MKKAVVGVVLALVFSTNWAQTVVPLPMVCDLDVQAFEKLMKDQKMVSRHESLIQTPAEKNVGLQVYTNKNREAVAVIWFGPDHLCLVGSGATVDIKKLNDATRRQQKKQVPQTPVKPKGFTT